MVTIERFYFNEDEIEVSAGGSKSEWYLLFAGESLNLKISVLRRRELMTLLERIQEVGQAILDASDGSTPKPGTRRHRHRGSGADEVQQEVRGIRIS